MLVFNPWRLIPVILCGITLCALLAPWQNPWTYVVAASLFCCGLCAIVVGAILSYISRSRELYSLGEVPSFLARARVARLNALTVQTRTGHFGVCIYGLCAPRTFVGVWTTEKSLERSLRERMRSFCGADPVGGDMNERMIALSGSVEACKPNVATFALALFREDLQMPDSSMVRIISNRSGKKINSLTDKQVNRNIHDR